MITTHVCMRWAFFKAIHQQLLLLRASLSQTERRRLGESCPWHRYGSRGNERYRHRPHARVWWRRRIILLTAVVVAQREYPRVSPETFRPDLEKYCLYVTVTVTAVTSGRCRGLGTKRSHREQAAKIVQWAVSCRLASGNDRTRYVCSDKSSPGLRSTRQRLALAHTYNSKELYSIKIPHTCLVQYAHVSIRQHSCYEHGNTRFTYVRCTGVSHT